MEVKPGYKQTEVGLIPDDWHAKTIGQLATKVGSGITPRGGSSNYREFGRPFVRSQNVGWGTLLLNDLVYIDNDTHETFAATEIWQGDILLNITGASIGRSAIADIHLVGGNVNQHVCIIRSDSREASSTFINYFLLSDLGQRQIDSFQAGGNRAGLNFGQIRSLKLPLPPTKAEQEAIADTLSNADALIESLAQLLAKKRYIKQGAMQELLTGKKRLAGFGPAGWVKTAIGDLPSDWQVSAIEVIAQVKTEPFGSSLHEKDYVDNGTPIITVEHLGERGIVPKNLPMVADPDRRRLITYALQEGDIVFSRVGSVDRNARVTASESGWLFSGRLLRLRASSDIVDTKYLSHHFHTELFKQRVRTVAVGQTMASLNTQILKSVLVALPPLREQTAIAGILSDMDAEIAALEAKIAKARQIKQSMMQELLTGRIRFV